MSKNKEQLASEREFENWVIRVRNHITDPNSQAVFGALDVSICKNKETVNDLLDTLDNIAYGGFGHHAFVVRRDKKHRYPVDKVIQTGEFELEVGMGQRLKRVTNPFYGAVYGRNVLYIPWPDGHPRFEVGRKANRIVTLSFRDLSRVKPDEVIEESR